MTHSRLMPSAICCLLLLSACRAPVLDSTLAGMDYFPLETGHYVIYGVEERQYAQPAAPVYRTYQLKEITGVPYTDVTGRTAYRLTRYRRATENQPWQPDSVWAVRRTGNEVIRTENGRDFVRLIVPVSSGLVWDRNRYNQLGPDAVTTGNAGHPYRVLTKQYDQTVTVSNQLDSTLLSLNKRTDVYARQVGLIYAERTTLQFCTATPACTGRAQIDYGTQQVYRILTYGTE